MSGGIPRSTLLRALEALGDRAPAHPPADLAFEAIGAGYLAYLRASRTRGDDDRHPDAWTWDVADDLVRTAPDLCLDLLCTAVGQCRDLDDRGNLAAGHLEDLIAQRGAEVIARIEALAQGNPRFRLALTGVWP